MVVRRTREVDDRGRELQQVETGSRFWWRALDAQTPDPGSFRVPAAHNSAAPLGLAKARPVISAAGALSIHSSERRARRRKSLLARHAGLAAVAFTLMAGAGAAVIAAPEIDFDKPSVLLSKKTTAALIALGFGIGQVNITGQRYTNDADVFDALDLANVPTFMAFNAPETLKRINRIAWVESAQITRQYPGTLNIEIRERTPSALWLHGGKTYLVDVTGRVLGPVPQKNGWELPRVSGEGANTEIATLLTAVSRNKVLDEQFDHGERIAERRWSVVLRNGSRIELGADREVEGLDQVAGSRTLLAAIAGRAVVIDVRVPGRMTVRPLEDRVAAAEVTRP